MFNTMAPIDEVSVIVYANSGLPVYDFAVPDYSTHPNIDVFLNGAFLLDPYYLAATRYGKYGFFRLRDLTPSGFKSSEYYRVYYDGSGVGGEFLLKPLLATDINPGTAFPSGNHPGGRFFGPRYYVSRRGELRRALGEHVHGCNNP